jgi:nicotinamide mononucleotide transporter
MSPLEIFAAIVGAISVYLSVRQNIWSWPTAIVNVVIYTLVFHELKLYADMGLQVIYAVLSVYGWYEWLHGGENRQELHVSVTNGQLWIFLALIGAVASVVLGLVLKRFTDATLPYLDATLSSTSLVAQWMMTKKKLENWIVWIVVDIVYVPMYVYKHAYATAILYAVFLVLAVRGYLDWKKSYQLRLVGP